jgi:2-amino-4-hydroxy-6-hydroxymethyldihydropteridine diphosphokinase
MNLFGNTQNSPVLLAFGANLPCGDLAPSQTITQALQALQSEGLELVRLSRFYRSPAFPAGAGPDYVNGAVQVAGPAADDVAALLALLHRIEARFGRERQQRWGQRTLDLDLLAAGDSVLPDAATQDRWRHLPPKAQAREAPDRLILPHPRLQDRAFVLVPLADIAPDWRHPRLGHTVTEMLAALPAADRAALVPL